MLRNPKQTEAAKGRNGWFRYYAGYSSEFVTDVLQKATTARWPMYIRNVKQLLRAADNAFDERRYGFGGLMDLLRACQRESVMLLERDRRGGLGWLDPGSCALLSHHLGTGVPSVARYERSG